MAYSYKYKIAIALYLLLGLYVCFNLYLGLSSFFITVYIYSLAGLASFWLGKKLRINANVQLLLFSVLFALFAGEFILRFIIKYPITYSEERGNGYSSIYKSTRQDYLQLKLLGGRKDIHTLQFDSGEIRNYQCSDYHFPAETCNTLGLRGALPAKSQKVILFLGDSFTEGAGAPPDSSIPYLVGKYITGRDSSVAVLNAGVSGNDIFFDWKMAQKLVPKLPVQQIVFITNTTDITDVLVRGGNERFCANGNLSYRNAPWWETLYSVSVVFRLVMHNALKLNYLLLSPQQEQIGKQEAIKKMAALVKEQIAPWANNLGIPVLIVLIPLKPDTELHNEDYTRLSDSLKSVGGGVKVLDCLPSIQGMPDIPSLYWTTDHHFKPRGYNIISQYIIDNCYR